MNGLTTALTVLVAPSLVLGVLDIAYMALGLGSLVRDAAVPPGLYGLRRVSVIVPAYNEEVVLARCVESILADDYPAKEIILVDDGSSDGTWRIMQRYRRRRNVTAIRQKNQGKAVALNRGISKSSGELIVFVDADGLFTGKTLRRLAAAFADPRVGAACGNDAPVNLDRVQPQLLALLTHVTAMVRRALALVNCLTIVSGNCGAVRSDVLARTGWFTPGIIGEDLELTWRVRKAGYRVEFCAGAIVHAEVPSTLSMLWRQRVRWSRGYLQTLRLHRDLVGRPGHGVLGPYLLLNVFGQVIAPLAQLAAIVVLLGAWAAGLAGGWEPPLATIGWVLLALPVISVAVAAAINRAPADLRYSYTLVAMPAYSLAMSAVLLTAIGHEVAKRPAAWNKFERTGTNTRQRVQPRA